YRHRPERVVHHAGREPPVGHLHGRRPEADAAGRDPVPAQIKPFFDLRGRRGDRLGGGADAPAVAAGRSRRQAGGKSGGRRDPDIMKVANTWLILNEGGGPTDDKPTVTLETPRDPNRTSAFMNVRVADIAKCYEEWRAKGAEFLTEPKDHGREIRAYIRDPD